MKNEDWDFYRNVVGRWPERISDELIRLDDNEVLFNQCIKIWDQADHQVLDCGKYPVKNRIRLG